MEAIREAMQPIGSMGGTRDDHLINIHHTHGVDTDGSLGSIGLVMSPSGRDRRLWRFRDVASDDIRLRMPTSRADLEGDRIELVAAARNGSS